MLLEYRILEQLQSLLGRVHAITTSIESCTKNLCNLGMSVRIFSLVHFVCLIISLPELLLRYDQFGWNIPPIL